VATARELLLVEMDASLALLGKGPANAFTTTGVLTGAVAAAGAAAAAGAEAAAGAAADAVAVAAAAVAVAAAAAAASAAALPASVAVAVPVVPAAFAAAAILVLAAVAVAAAGDFCLICQASRICLRLSLSGRFLPCFLLVVAVAETAVTEQISLVSTAPSTVLNSNLAAIPCASHVSNICWSMAA
jgi:hypothetical protein